MRLRATLIFCLLIFLVGSSPAQSPPNAPPSQAASSQSAGKKPSAADIAAAKASGKVWVNLNTGIYHRGGRWYGKTNSGKFMTVEEAKKAGYKSAKRD